MPPVRIAVKVTPKASKDEVAGWRGSELVVRVTSPPEGGKANDSLCAVLAGALGIPKSAVSVLRGSSARRKLLQLDGVDEETVARVLGRPGGEGWDRD